MGQSNTQPKRLMNIMALIVVLLAGGKSVSLFCKYKELIYVHRPALRNQRRA
jgi:hypothetical protein